MEYYNPAETGIEEFVKRIRIGSKTREFDRSNRSDVNMEELRSEISGEDFGKDYDDLTYEEQQIVDDTIEDSVGMVTSDAYGNFDSTESTPEDQINSYIASLDIEVNEDGTLGSKE